MSLLARAAAFFTRRLGLNSSRRRTLTSLLALLVGSASRSLLHLTRAAPPDGEEPSAKPKATTRGKGAAEWRTFGGSRRMDRYSPLAQIDRTNVHRLKTVWTRPGVDESLTRRFSDLVPSAYLYGTPIMIDGVLYATNAVGLVEAFDAVSGKTRWVQQPHEATLQGVSGSGTRGVEYWRDGADERIIVLRGEYLYALDARSGTPRTEFGDQGRVWLDRHTPDHARFIGFNGPILVGDAIILGGNGGGLAGEGYGDGGPEVAARPEDIRAYDVRSGRHLWTFQLIPPPGDPRRASWGKDSADLVGNMAAWAPLSADEELGYVYVPLTAPTNSYYGGHRPGDNLYADCLVALDARSGKLVWYFQTVHHDLWDFDNASAPTLGDIHVDGRRIRAVMQPNKSGYLFVFDRVTGKPVWPIVERPVPQSTVPGESTARTQPVPTRPPPLDRQGITEDDLIDFTPEIRRKALEFVADYQIGPLFSSPSLLDEHPGGKKGTLAMPGGWGSANWNTGAFDPETGIYYAVTMTLPGIYALQQPGPDAKVAYGPTIAYEITHSRPAGGQRSAYGPGPDGLPLLKPPYGRITALDMNTGEKLWMVPNGEGPRNHPLLKGLDLPPLGTIGRPVALVTRTLLFLGESSDAVLGAGVAGEAKFRAYDKRTGAVLWETTLPAGTTGGPVTYEVAGEQYIVVPIGGESYGSGWVAMRLE